MNNRELFIEKCNEILSRIDILSQDSNISPGAMKYLSDMKNDLLNILEKFRLNTMYKSLYIMGGISAWDELRKDEIYDLAAEATELYIGCTNEKLNNKSVVA